MEYFPKKLYELRKKNGLSQEQLAEALQVSRQAISKWETGTAMPESEKLIAISTYFGVSLDDLLKGEAAETAPHLFEGAQRGVAMGHLPRLLSWLLILGALAGLIAWGVLALSGASDQIAASSAVVLDGNGIFLLASLASLALGVFFLSRLDKQNKQ